VFSHLPNTRKRHKSDLIAMITIVYCRRDSEQHQDFSLRLQFSGNFLRAFHFVRLASGQQNRHRSYEQKDRPFPAFEKMHLFRNECEFARLHKQIEFNAEAPKGKDGNFSHPLTRMNTDIQGYRT